MPDSDEEKSVRATDESGKPQSQSEEQPQQVEQATQQMPDGQAPTPPAKKKKPLYKRPWFWILIVVIAFFVILFIAGIAASVSTTSSSTSSTSSRSYETTTQNSSSQSSDSSAPTDTSSNPDDATPTNTKTPFVESLAALGEFEEVVLTGSGDDVVDLPCPGLSCLMDVSYTGEHNFSVKILNAEGESEDLLVNEIGAYFGTVTNYRDRNDSYMLEVHASGDWSITVRPMSSMAPLENGVPYEGSNVMYIDADSMSKLSITNASEHNFVVYGIGMDKADLLVNEIGDYSGTVAWNQDQCFLMVEDTGGTWSVSW